jgi:hypothetical protein
MTETNTFPFTVVLETTEPFGREIQVIQEEAADGEEAALRAMHHWHNREFDPNVEIEELEDGTAWVLAVLHGHNETALVRNPSQNLV